MSDEFELELKQYMGGSIDGGEVEAARWARTHTLESAEVTALVEALRMQHRWQQEIGVVALPGGYELNLSLEYSDSTMCERTEEALAAFARVKESE